MFADVIAIHEAGHVFVAVALDLAVSRVQLGEPPAVRLRGRAKTGAPAQVCCCALLA
jgi:hypothetical protein